MEERIIDEEIILTTDFPEESIMLAWYQDPILCRQVDNTDTVYTLERLRAMYSWLKEHGQCWCIMYRGIPVGDCTLQDSGEIAIVISTPYQNRHIGRRCVREMCRLAAENGMERVTARIYSFNEQSRRMFLSAGFRQTDDEWYTFTVE
ncbi:MAG: GNAT family N-acetyltransferase [Solobacterium sp.]|nr:GNAT family N-acetyltransferase [Solobacterium sp.]MBQ1446025.1 GNAT family N-acetyltransferase [Solobacterium sp.]MBR2728048.1 GNAT family N-acetyltransferase [Solobacterium sp.]